MNPDELLDGWARLSTPRTQGQLEAIEVREAIHVWIAVDSLDARHLLVRVPEGTQVAGTTTKGMSVGVARHRIPGNDDADYIDLVCLDDDTLDTFATVAADICTDLVTSEPSVRASTIAQALARWRWFWGITADRLSERDALGLFAELWFLDQWAGVTPESVDAWAGSEGARHDFQWTERSVEVKATSRRADGAVVHTIQQLDQLADPETGVLYLFSLRVVRDRLAANTLPALVERCSEQLRATATTREAFLRKVSTRGYSPAHHQLHSTPYRILEERLYEVDDDFPRLTAASFPIGLPPGVGDVAYKLEMAACSPWLVTDRPAGWPPEHAHGEEEA